MKRLIPAFLTVVILLLGATKIVCPKDKSESHNDIDFSVPIHKQGKELEKITQQYQDQQSKISAINHELEKITQQYQDQQSKMTASNHELEKITQQYQDQQSKISAITQEYHVKYLIDTMLTTNQKIWSCLYQEVGHRCASKQKTYAAKKKLYDQKLIPQQEFTECEIEFRLAYQSLAELENALQYHNNLSLQNVVK